MNDYQGVKSGGYLCTNCLRALQYSTVQYSTVQYSTVQYSTVQYSTVQYSTVQYSTVQYNTIKRYCHGIYMYNTLLFYGGKPRN